MRYAAFFRAINLAGHNAIRMAELRERSESAGLRNVSTYLQSGNLLFESDLDSSTAASALESAFPECRAIVVRDASDLLRVSKLPAMTCSEKLYVCLFREPLVTDLPRLSPKGDVEILHLSPTEAICRRVTREGDPHRFIERSTGTLCTARYGHVIAAISDRLQNITMAG